MVLPPSLKPYLYSHLISHIGARFLAILPNADDVPRAAAALAGATKLRIVSHADPSKRIGPAPNFLITTPNALVYAQDRQHLQQHTQRLILLDDVDQLQTHSAFSRVISFVFSAGTAPARIIALVSDTQHDLSETNTTYSSLCLTQAVHLSVQSGKVLHVEKKLSSVKSRRPHRTDIRHTVSGTLALSARTGSPADTFFSRVSTSTASPFAKSLHSLVSLMAETMNRIRTPASPLFMPAITHNPWAGFTDSVAAHSANASVLLENSFSYWKQALDVIVRTWEQADWASLVLLRQAGCDADEAINIWPSSVAAQIRTFWKSVPFNHQPLFRLRGIALENAKALVPFRLIVVVDFAILAHAVEYYVKKDSTLRQFRPVVFYAVDENSEASSRLTPRQARLNLDNYSTNNANMLITTADFELRKLELFTTFLILFAFYPDFSYISIKK